MFFCFQGKAPLAEIDFWRERNATLSALSEQLKLPTVKKVLNVLSIADPGLVQNLDLTVTELAKYHVEAADNVRFLTTLERHLKVSVLKGVSLSAGMMQSAKLTVTQLFWYLLL